MSASATSVYPSRSAAIEATIHDAWRSSPLLSGEEPAFADCFTPDYRPFPKQLIFHRDPHMYRLYGGAAGGGKSRAMVQEGIRLSRVRPGVNGVLWRRTYPELEESLIREFRKRMPADQYRWNEQKHEARFTNGSRLVFRHCQHEGDVYAYQSAQFDWMGFDELAHFTPAQFDYLCTRCRTTLPGWRVRIFAASNPGGACHHLMKSRWIDRDADQDDPTLDLSQYSFTPAFLQDNPAMAEFDPTYSDRLMRLPEQERKALLEGDWDTFAGKFFTEWSTANEVEPFPIPEAWPKWRSFDYGSTAAASCGWLTMDPGTDPPVFYRYREHYRAGQDLEWHAEEIKRLSGSETYRRSVADPSMKGSKDARGRDLLSQFNACGLSFVPADNDRLAGWRLMKSLIQPAMGGPPRFKVFNTCRDFIRTVKVMRYDDRVVGDLDTKLEDHAVDDCRYGLMEAAVSAVSSKPVKGAHSADMLRRSSWGTGL